MTTSNNMNDLNPQDPDSPLYEFIDTQPEDTYPANPNSSLSHFTVRQFVPESITAAFPMVVTITGHGFQNGQTLRATKFYGMSYGGGTGMEQLNNRLFYVQQATTDTFQLYDQNALPIDGSNYTPYVSGGEFTLSGPTLPVVNPSHFPSSGVPPFPPT